MRLFFVFVSVVSTLSFLQANIGNQIKRQASYLNSKGKMEKKIVRKLNDLAYAIIIQTKNLKKLKKKIDDLDVKIKSNEINIANKYKILNTLLGSNKELTFKKKSLEKKIVNIIAKDFSYYLIGDGNYIETKDSILVDEIMKKMDIVLKKEFRKFSSNYEKVNSKIRSGKKEIKNIKAEIDNSQKQRDKLLLLKRKREQAIVRLNREKRAYKRRLDRIKRDKLTIRATLERLKILKKEQKIKVSSSKKSKKTKLGVRQIGSSYQSSKVKRYRGTKTIAPLKSFVVKRKFGNYVDPIYNIKIFNESVTLESKIDNAKVKNILNGKVVFAKDTAVLDKVVIIENANGIHTIYAHLSKIAPTIRVGKKIRKGYVIGRVKNDLTFEVTQKNYHINPLELIRIN